MVGSLARLLSIVSLALCAIVIASFAIFVIDETKTASGQQQEQLTAASGAGVPASEATTKPAQHPGRIHRAIDEAASAITSPFEDVVSASSGEWADRGAKLVLALALYGFGLGFLSRMLRVHL